MSKQTVRNIDIEKDFTEEEVAVFQPTPKEKPKHPVFSKAAELQAPEEQDFEEEAVEEIPTPTSLDDIIAAQYIAGFSLAQIKTDNNISSGKIYGILARKGVPLRSGRYESTASSKVGKMSNKHKQLVIDSYVSGTPNEVLYRSFDLNKHGLYMILDEANIPRRHKHISTEAASEEVLKKSVDPVVQENTPAVGVTDVPDVKVKAEIKDGILIITAYPPFLVKRIMAHTVVPNQNE